MIVGSCAEIAFAWPNTSATTAYSATAAAVADGDERQRPHAVGAQHRALQPTGAEADQAVDERRQAERRLHQQVEGEAGEEPEDRPRSGPSIMPPAIASSRKTSTDTPATR